MTGDALDLDTCNAVADASDDTLRRLAGLIAASTSEEHMVYRETELDEVWRLLTAATADGDRAVLAARAAAIHDIHDMIAVSADPAVAAAAAARLRALAG